MTRKIVLRSEEEPLLEISEIKKLFSEQCDLLIQAGCDFYDLLSLYMNFAPFTEDDQRIILAYSDTLVYRIVEKVTVLSSEEIKIRFIGGFEITQPLY